MQPGRARTSSLGVPLLPLARWVGWVAPVCPTHGVLVFSPPPAPLVCAASWASRLLFTGVPARCVVLRVRRPGHRGSCSPVCPLGVLCCVCGVLGLPAPVHRCARSVCCVACAASSASRLLFTGVPARCVVLRVRRPGPPSSCSPVCPLGVLCCVCGVLGLPAPVHRCARSVCCVACAASWVSRLLFTGVPARCVVLRVRRPGHPGSCSPVRPLGVLCCVCGVLGLPAPVHRCARSVCCVACAASWASRLLFTGVPARCVVLRVRRPGPPGSCSPVCPLGVLCCVCGVLGLPAPVHRCARSVCCVACAASWASRLLFTGVPARCVVLCVRRPGPPGSCSPVCPLGVLCCVCGVLGLPAPIHRCARSVCCVACAASWASRLLFTGVPARRVVLRVRRPGPLGSCSPVCLLGVLCCVCGVLGLPAPVHRCARSACCVACAASWASRLLFTGALARCVVLRVRRPGPPGSCSPVCPLGVLCCVCGVLGLPAPVHRCARSVCCVACAASWASRLLFTGVPARRVVLRVRRPGPPGSCSPVRSLGVLCCVCGVLGLLAPVHRCARSVCCVAVWGAAAGRSLVHPDGGYRSRLGLGTLRAHTRPSGRRLFVAGRGWVPSGRALVHPDGGCSLPAGVGYPPGAHSSIRTAAGVRVLALCGRVGRAGLPGALWCASPFPLAALSFCFAWPPPGWGCPPLSCCPCRSSLPWRRALVVFLGLPLPASSCARASFVSFVSPPCPSLFVSRCFRRSCLVPWCCFFFFFFFPFFSCAPPLSPAFSGFRPRVPWASALCVVCFVGLLPLGSPCACPSFVLSAWLVLAPRWLLPPPPPLFVSWFSSLPLGAVCRLLRCAVRPSVRCCAVLCSLGAAACCAAPSGAARCPGALCSAALRFAVFPRAVCVLSWRGGACCCWPLCFVLCVSRGNVLCVLCPLRLVRCCASLCWCARVVLCVWCSLLLAPGAVVCRGAVLGLVARGCLLVAFFGVPVWPRGLFPCGWCGLLWCPAFLCRVLWCCAVAWCCAVVLCCRVAVLLGLALPSCGLSCCAVLCCWLAVLFFARWWCLRAVVLFSSCCAFPVFSALCAAVPCCAGCGALLPCVVCCGAVLLCRAVLSCCAVVLRCCLCLLCPPAARRAAPVSSALLLVPRAVACPCALWSLLGRSAVWWCCSGVSWCLAVLCVVLWCPASCAVSCGAVLPCGAVLVCLLCGCGCTYLPKPPHNFVKYFFFFLLL